MMSTEHVQRQQQFYMEPTMLQLNGAVTTLVDIQNMLCNAAVTLSYSHTARMQWFCSEAENNAIVAIFKYL